MARVWMDAVSLLALACLCVSQKPQKPDATVVGEAYENGSATWRCGFDSEDVGLIKHVSWYIDNCFTLGVDDNIMVYHYTSDGTDRLYNDWETRSVDRNYSNEAHFVTLNDITLADERFMCCCIARNTQGTDRSCSDNTLIDIYVRPDDAYIENAEKLIALENMPTEVECIVDRVNPPDKLLAYWKVGDEDEAFDETRRVEEANDDDHTATVHSYFVYTFQKEDHNPRVNCIVKWKEVTGSESDITAISAAVTLNYAPGKASVSTGVHQTDVEDSITLTCTLDGEEGKPAHSKFGFTNGTWTSQTQTSDSIEVQVLSIKPLYRCFAVTVSNDNNSTELPGEYSEPAEYQVYVPAASLYPNDETTGRKKTPLYNDTEFKLICEATGYPDPTVDLAYVEDGVIVNITSEEEYIEYREDIEIVYKYDVSQGIRVNFTWNIVDKDFTCDNVDAFDWEFIKCLIRNEDVGGNLKEDTSMRYCIYTQYPPLWKGKEVRAEFEQKNVNLTCDTCAYSEDDGTYIQFKWFANGTRIEGQNGKVLRIQQATDAEFTTHYECEASNSLDTKRYNVLFMESGPPLWINTNLTVLENVSSVAVTLLWEIGRDGNHPVSYTIWYISNESEEINLAAHNVTKTGNLGDTVNFTVTDLNATTKHEFIVQASNSRNPAEGSNVNEENITATATTLERPSVNIQDVQISSNEMRVTWLYEERMRRFRSSSVSVGVKIRYWKSDDESEEDGMTHPQTGVIPAHQQQETISSDFYNGEYTVKLLIYENEHLSQSSGNTILTEDANVPALTDSEVAMIIGVIVLLIVALLLIGGFILYKITRSGNTETSKEYASRATTNEDFVNLPATEISRERAGKIDENSYTYIDLNNINITQEDCAAKQRDQDDDMQSCSNYEKLTGRNGNSHKLYINQNELNVYEAIKVDNSTTGNAEYENQKDLSLN